MQLYHYAAKQFDALKTRRASGVATADEIRKAEAQAKKFHDEGAYVDHISFFFDPIPSKTLGQIFGADHAVWYPGSQLFEYVVDVEALGDDVLYRVVESLRRTVFLDKFSKDNNWESDDPAILSRYISQINALQKKWGELGRGIPALRSQILLNKGKTEENYLAAAARPDFADGKHRYASNVPHLMAYPTSGVVAYKAINKLVIGNDARTPVNLHSTPAMRW